MVLLDSKPVRIQVANAGIHDDFLRPIIAQCQFPTVLPVVGALVEELGRYGDNYHVINLRNGVIDTGDGLRVGLSQISCSHSSRGCDATLKVLYNYDYCFFQSLESNL